MSLDQLIERVPHRDPFLFVSSIERMTEGHVSAKWIVTGEEWFLKGHFPGRPLVPGVLLTEALAQVAGLAADPGEEPRGGMLVSSEMRFRTPVTPPAEITLEATLQRSMGQLHLLEVTASQNEVVCASGTIGLMVEDPELEQA